MRQMPKFDLMVIGAGHAGCEAALAAARAGARVVCVTLRLGGIGQMSCNPAIGGVGKGQLVREIDALGGAMGEVADETALQCRRLNASRGAAVRSTRVQSDAQAYKTTMAARLLSATGVEVWADEATDLTPPSLPGGTWEITCVGRGRVVAGAVVVTTGTFLNGLCHVGGEHFAGGRIDEPPVSCLSAALRALGVAMGRFKTGTTPRLAADSIAWERLRIQWGDSPPPRFASRPPERQLAPLPCHLTATQPATHQLVRDNLADSPLYRGIIAGTGPRYCPSLEDKVVRFAQRQHHQVFLEPEGHSSPRIYPSGLSTCLPKPAQEAFLRTIPGLEAVRVLQHGYAVEYDYAPPTQLLHSLMVRRWPGLFLAGQINGSSGYEEAAAQGLMAGINAARWLAGEPPAVLGRHEAYIGVLIDDLVTQGVDEPYRIFTGRAEHRLDLRESNAERRLAACAQAWGMWGSLRKAAFADRETARAGVLGRITAERWSAPLGARLGQTSTEGLALGTPLAAVLRRPDVCLPALWAAMQGAPAPLNVLTEVEETLIYAPFIAREVPRIRQLQALDAVSLPADLDYSLPAGLCTEAREKLQRLQPTTLGQASRIPGIDPVTLSILRIYLRRVGTGGEQA